MGERLNLTVYIRDREFFYYSGTKKISGIFESEKEVLDFLKENKVASLTVILSRPAIFVRKLQFPFSSLKKISQVILEEASPLFPVSAENLEFFWYPVEVEKSKTTVSVVSFEKSKIEKWKRLSISHRFKIRTIFEPFILSNYIWKTIQQASFAGIFIDANYVSRIIVRNNLVIESSSMYIEHEMLESDLLHLIEENTEGLPVVCLAGSGFPGGNTGNFKIISLERKDFPSTMFSLIESYPGILSVPVKLYSVKKAGVSINSALVVWIILFLALSSLMLKPVFIAKQAQSKLDTLNRQMEQIFKSAFPEVTRVINPLVQARERLKNTGDVQQSIPKISVISIMRTISDIVPEKVPFKVSQMSLRGSDLFLTCSTDTLENVEVLVQIFNRVKSFRDIKVGGIMPEGGQVSFTLLIKVAEDVRK